ncbi:MAG: CDP-alcohol phosphatidyltransferase family protein [Thermoproteota archaeon]|nr:MAG: CDP-alcohol phosphatidyltransferase family protein [Candidatus Korarchaeota archaeon]
MLAGLRERLEPLAGALARPFLALGVPPWALTAAGAAAALLMPLAAHLARGPAYWAVPALMVLSSLLDAVDGQVARRTGRASRSGAFLDSTLDRVSDAAYVATLYVLGVLGPLPSLALLASAYLVSYTRARAEALGLGMEGVGLAERGERSVLILLALLLYPFSRPASTAVAAMLLILSLLTFTQRVAYALRRLS